MNAIFELLFTAILKELILRFFPDISENDAHSLANSFHSKIEMTTANPLIESDLPLREPGNEPQV